MGKAGLWIRWSWRDLRSRWVQVAAIALIIALGSGVYAGMASSSEWRRTNYDASYAALNVHDLQATTAEDTFAVQGELRGAVAGMEHPEWVTDAEERLVLPTQVDASTPDEQILVPGRIVGVEVDAGGPTVDQFHIEEGRGLEEADAGEPVAVLDYHFAQHHGLPTTGTLQVAGGATLEYVGQGYTPEYFMIASDQGSFLAEAGFAVVFTSLETAQQLSSQEDSVNDLVVTLADGVDAAAAQVELEAALASQLPDVAVTVTPLEEDRLYRILYDDIEGDQRLFNIFAVLILAGAAFAAFNLTGRIVEAQRREIGIGMSLGVTRPLIALRPLLVGLEIALLGVVFGVGVGLVVGGLLSAVSQQFIPLPVWDAPFQPLMFLRGIALGLVLIVLATIYPVWRAVRVDPIDAIRTGPIAAKQSRLMAAIGRIPLPGRSVAQMPLRNVVRAPRRTILTALGIAAAIATLIAVIGMVDSFFATIDRGEAEILGQTPERVDVNLDFFYPTESDVVAGIEATEGVAQAEAVLDIGGMLGEGDDQFEVFIGLVDFDSDVWHPTALDGSLATEGPAIVLSEKAARDLGVEPGDQVPLRYPKREGLGYSFVDGEVTVAAIHPNPYRFVTYMDIDDAEMMNLVGIVNAVEVVPEPGYDLDRLERDLFEQSGVASVQGVGATAQTMRDLINEMIDFLTVVRGAVLLLALLIAFNSSSISADERSRDHATMFAFGLPVRSVMGVSVAESFIVGVIGTVLGIGLGLALLGWLVRVLLPGTMPDLTIQVAVQPATYVTAAVLGILAVSIAPLFTMRKLRKMDIPSTLRVVE